MQRRKLCGHVDPPPTSEGGIGQDNGLVCVFKPESMMENWWLNPCQKVMIADGQIMLADKGWDQPDIPGDEEE